MSKISEFFCDEQILITGGTGFVGKLLISKLLLSCPKLKKIILLVRRKENETWESRKNKLFKNKIFENLEAKIPDYKKRIEFVEGNCEYNQMGLTQMNKFLITQYVTIIFHCAANVQFDEDLKTEININVFGAIEILNLAKYVRNLKAFVYVSSSYSNCHRAVIEEKYYVPNVHYSTLLKLTKGDFLNMYEKHILDNVKSTYFYSKAAAEQAVFERGRGLPIAIFRPSAILSTWLEPIPGWTNRAFAPTALVKFIILGYFSSLICSDNTIVDMVPGDLTVNALISVAWDIHNRYVNGNLNEPRFYNYVSMMDNPITFKTFISTVFNKIAEKPCSKSVWYPTLCFHESKLKNTLCSFIRPKLIVFSMQIYYFLTRNVMEIARLQSVCRTYDTLVNLLENSMKNPHIFTNDNIRELWNDLNEKEKKKFFFDLKQFHWPDYLELYYDGVLEYILKDEDRDEKLARRHFLKLQIIYSCVVAILWAAGISIVCIIFFNFFTNWKNVFLPTRNEVGNIS